MPQKEHPSHTHGDGTSPSWDAINKRNRRQMKAAKKLKAWDNRICSPKEPCTPNACSVKDDCTWYSHQSEKKNHDK